ncbi:PAS domain-containing protein [Aestuariibacter salexigens]|uniref:PAS domain-containing protein n=1 Tax=Aestuariibacter salexigens TaxID=226010 RepID=UPI000418522D|nr:PAS domain-containing protein [Aestuariibacter salexigens]
MESVGQLVTFAKELFDESFLPVIATDNKAEGFYKTVYVNPAFCHITGFSEDELLGQSPSILQGPRSNPRTLRQLAKSLQKGEGFTGVSFNYRKDKTTYPVRWNITPFKNDANQVIGFFSVQRDLSHAWAILNNLTKENKALKKKMARLEANSLSSVSKNSSDDIFFDFDDAVNDIVPTLNRPALSAREYLLDSPIDKDDLAAIEDTLYELQSLIILHVESLDDIAECQKIVSLINEFSKQISFLIEFIDVSDAIEKLSVAFDELKSKKISGIALQSLRELVEELCTWFVNIFVDQTSDDIHSLDASIIASARQIIVFLKMG